MLTTAQKLEAAKDAKHKLVTGLMARVFMDQNGERVEFTMTNVAQLDRYIEQLETSLSPARAVARRPLGFLF